MKSIAIIPARLNSKRLPRKVLMPIAHHPMIWHVCNRVRQCSKIESLYVTTDSLEIAETVRAYGIPTIMSSSECENGTARIASVIDGIDADLIVNVQADQPTLDPDIIDRLLLAFELHDYEVTTPIFQITKVEDLYNRNIVKVVRSLDGNALYFSRSAIPHVYDQPLIRWSDHGTFWGHIGIYAFRRRALERYSTLKQGDLEILEHLEQLRLLEAGIRLQTVEYNGSCFSVDTIRDLRRVRRLFSVDLQTKIRPNTQ